MFSKVPTAVFPLHFFCAVIFSFLSAVDCARSDEVRIFGDKIVGKDEVISGDVIAVTGNLIIRGQVAGNAVAMIGDVILDSSAVVNGDVIAKQGRIYRNEGALVSGDLIEGSVASVKIGRSGELDPLRLRSGDFRDAVRRDDDDQGSYHPAARIQSGSSCAAAAATDSFRA